MATRHRALRGGTDLRRRAVCVQFDHLVEHNARRFLRCLGLDVAAHDKIFHHILHLRNDLVFFFAREPHRGVLLVGLVALRRRTQQSCCHDHERCHDRVVHARATYSCTALYGHFGARDLPVGLTDTGTGTHVSW